MILAGVELFTTLQGWTWAMARKHIHSAVIPGAAQREAQRSGALQTRPRT